MLKQPSSGVLYEYMHTIQPLQQSECWSITKCEATSLFCPGYTLHQKSKAARYVLCILKVVAPSCDALSASNCKSIDLNTALLKMRGHPQVQ